MSIGLRLVTAPASDPVALADVKNYLRIDTSTDDAMLTAFITAATRLIESYISRKLITQTWDLWMDKLPYEIQNGFDAQGDYAEGKLSEYLKYKRSIDIPLFPLQSVTFFKTYDDAGTAYTFASSNYIVDDVGEPPRISVKNSTTWPTTFLRPINSVQIQFVVGYGSNSSDVPEPIRQAIMELVGKFYMNRGCQDTELPAASLALLLPYRSWRA